MEDYFDGYEEYDDFNDDFEPGDISDEQRQYEDDLNEIREIVNRESYPPLDLNYSMGHVCGVTEIKYGQDNSILIFTDQIGRLIGDMPTFDGNP